MTTIVGLSGSLRSGSYNASLLRAAQALAPEGLEVRIGSIAAIPLYDGDLERREGIPEPVAQLKEKIVAADGLLLVTPEYNSGIPGVFKNAIDWLSRPPGDIARVFGGRAVGVIGATPGRGGTRMAQTAWLPILRTLGTRPYFGQSLYLAGATEAFDGSGELVDEKLRELLGRYMQGLAAFIGT